VAGCAAWGIGNPIWIDRIRMARHYLGCTCFDVWYLYIGRRTGRDRNRPLPRKRFAALVGFFCGGLISIAAAVVALIWPQLAGLIIVLVIATWAVLTGILEIVAAIRLRHEINNEWLLALGGIISIALGFLLFLKPIAGGIAIIWTVAAYAVIFGVLLIALGFRLKNQNVTGDRQALRSA
jgi:MFS family permease